MKKMLHLFDFKKYKANMLLSIMEHQLLLLLVEHSLPNCNVDLKTKYTLLLFELLNA